MGSAEIKGQVEMGSDGLGGVFRGHHTHWSLGTRATWNCVVHRLPSYTWWRGQERAGDVYQTNVALKGWGSPISVSD